MRPQLDGLQVPADALAAVFGWGEFTQRAKRTQATIAAVDAGFLRRELFLARGPADDGAPRCPKSSGRFRRFLCRSAPADGSGSIAQVRPTSATGCCPSVSDTRTLPSEPGHALMVEVHYRFPHAQKEKRACPISATVRSRVDVQSREEPVEGSNSPTAYAGSVSR